MDGIGREIFKAYGPLPLPNEDQSIFAAELWAVCMALTSAVAPVRIRAIARVPVCAYGWQGWLP